MRWSILAVLLLVACVQTGQKPAVITETQPVAPSADLPPIVLPQRVTAVGYGAMPNIEGLSLEQRRILSMRAAKLDAYRALAEIVDGLKITGSSTVSAVALTNDSFRVYVEAYLRGARLLTTTPLPGGSYECVVELQLGGDFYKDAMAASRGVALTQSASRVVVARPTEAPATEMPVEAPSVHRVSPSDNFYLSK